MGDRPRGALFNVLGDVDGLRVLDAFAGSGALAIEALSRGAAFAQAVEIDKAAIRALRENQQRLNLSKTLKITQANAGSWSGQNPSAQFDIVFCDPPYDDLQLAVVQKMVRHVAPGGLLVLSWPGGLAVPELVMMNIVAQKSYGDATLVFYRGSRPR
jgi:16S rRNA (guanine966-N2)-methyltransferase